MIFSWRTSIKGGVIQTSNRVKGGIAEEQKNFITKSLEKVSADILDLLHRITFHALSGLE